MNILNEDLQSNFLRTIYNNLKTDFKEDNESQVSFLNDAIELFKKVFEYGKIFTIDNKKDEEKRKQLKELILNFREKYNLSSYDVEDLNNMIGISDYRTFDPKVSSYSIKRIKDNFKKIISGDYSNKNVGKIRKNGSSSINKTTNSFEFISKILNKGWGSPLDIANISDDDIKMVHKIPKLITDRSPLYDNFLFWFKSNSDNIESEDISNDKLVGISRGQQVYYPESIVYHGKYESLKIKDLAQIANKLFALSVDKNSSELLYNKRRERTNSQNIFKYKKLESYQRGYDTPVILDEFPDPNKINSPEYINVDDVVYYKSSIGKVFNNNEFIRDYEYAEMIEKKIQEYKTAAEKIRIERKEKNDSFDKNVSVVVKSINKYLYTSDITKTGDLRRIYSKLDMMLKYYEEYISDKQSLKNNFSDYRKREMNENRQKVETIILELLKIIDNK